MINQKKPTKIEIKMENYLLSENINFIKNYRIGLFLIDFYLVDFNIAVECDGDYWHSNPLYFTDDNLTISQIKNKDRDLRKSKLLSEQNIKLIRFWETDIHTKFNDVTEVLRLEIEKFKQLM